MLNRRTAAPRSRTAGLALCLAAASAALFGCSGSDGDSGAKPQAGPSVIAPGKPGETPETLSAAEAAKQRPDETPNSADYAYIQMMIKHHGQALTMTDLAADRAHGKDLTRLADRIASAQGPEIGTMKGWLKNHGGARKQKGHEHGSMPGMATEKQLDELRSARGEDFDRLFLKLMISHHDGAVTMATDVLAQGNNVLVEEMANDVVAQQTSEINRMRDMS